MILDKIVEATKVRVAQEKEVETPEAVKAAALALPSDTGFPFEAALRQQDFNFICEVKKASPSKGIIAEHFPYLDIAKEYEVAGAAAISVLTEPDFFKGDKKYLQEIASTVKIPVLRKDFIIDTYQLFQARVMGADAVLLIAAALTEEECRILAETAHSLQLEVLLEVHSEDELKYLNADIDMLGVNNRNLGTFHTDVNNSFKLVDKMRGFSPLLVSESGISETDTVRRLREAGFRGFLIGETFMKTERPGDTLADFIGGLA